MTQSGGLLVHVPKLRYHTYPFRNVSFINFMPMGLLAMADWATRAGQPTRVLHFGLASWSDPSFDLNRFIAERAPAVVGLPLHWYLAAHDVIEVCRRIKSAHPDVFVTLGGYTASYFAEEILATQDCVDGVIRGDGEVGFAELCAARSGGGDLARVSNLLWRDQGRVVANPRRVTDEALFNELDYANFDLAENKAQLPELHWIRFPRHPRLDRFFRRSSAWGRPFILAAMRGCAYDCAYCGGSRAVHEKLFGRRDPIVRRPDLIVRDYQRAIALGFDRGWMNTDPNSVRPDYYRGFFAAFAERGLRPLLHYEFYKLPNDEFLDLFRATCDPASRLNLTLESGDQATREKYRGIRFSNAEIVAAVKGAAARGIVLDIYLVNNFPEAEHVPGSRRFLRELRRTPGLPAYLAYYVGIMTDPGCDMFLHGERYGIEPTRLTFADFLAHTARPLVDVGFFPQHPERLSGQRWRGWSWGYRYPAYLANGLINFLIYLTMRLGLANWLPTSFIRLGNALFRTVRRFREPRPPADQSI